MRYLVPSRGRGRLDDQVARYFGRAANFVIIFEKKGQFAIEEVIKNDYKGIKFPGKRVAALAASDRDINVAVADNMVDSSRRVLENAGIKVSLGHHRITLKQAIKNHLKKP